MTTVKQCAREGCDQPVSANKSGTHRYSSFACRAVDFELKDAQRLCSAIGPASTAAGELWASAVALNDALSEYQRLDRKLRDVARVVGLTDDQWFAIKRPDRTKR